MAVPEFYRFIRPSLEFLADGKERHWTEVRDYVSRALALSEDDLAELIPSGVRSRAADRALWSLTYLRQAELITRPGRGKAKITERGVDYLRRAPEVIKPQDLEVFPEFVEFTRRTAKSKDATGVPVASDEMTPEDAIEQAFREHEAALAGEVLDAVKAMQPVRFERLIIELMLALGYGGADDAGRHLGGSGDGGVDGVINQDQLGLDKVYLQAKKWTDNSVGRKDVQAFVGALSGMGASKGVFITSSTFSPQAEDYARNIKSCSLSLVSGLELARLMIKHNIGVALRHSYDLKSLDSDFFSEV
jgi:restriction system protein